METVKISLNTQLGGFKEIIPLTILENDSKIGFYFNNNDVNDVAVGDILHLIREIGRDGYTSSLTQPCPIISKNKSVNITVLKIDPIVSPHHEVEKIEKFLDLEDGITSYKIVFKEAHNIYLQDLMGNSNIVLTAYNENGEELGHLYSNTHDLGIPNGYGFTFAQPIDTITQITPDPCDGEEPYNVYTFLPSSFDMHSLIVKLYGDFIDDISYFTYNFNPYYYYENDHDVKLWKDSFTQFSSARGFKENIVGINKDISYWSLPIQVSQNSNEVNLGVDEMEYPMLAEQKALDAIPEVINMEKTKIAPKAMVRGLLMPVKEIQFNLHFRERKIKEYAPNGDPIYDDGWYIDEEGGWNETGNTKSDLMGFLGFSDDDVYYRKEKVKKNFIRLSFFDTNNPLTQRLLFYSTIFIDSNTLYGNYIRLNKAINDGVVSFDGSKVFWGGTANYNKNRIESKFSVTNEYDKTRCSEGFNLYLFEDDVINSGKTIYMKVEFNHVGIGKVIPMLLLNSTDITQGGVSVDDYLSKLHIPLYCGKNNGLYYYWPLALGDNIQYSNDKLTYTLYEPKLL